MSEEIKCTTRGIFSLQGLHAACSNVIVGGKLCGIPYGGCHLQAAPEPSASVVMEPVSAIRLSDMEEIDLPAYGHVFFATQDCAEDYYSADQLATLQAKLEQALTLLRRIASDEVYGTRAAIEAQDLLAKYGVKK